MHQVPVRGLKLFFFFLFSLLDDAEQDIGGLRCSIKQGILCSR